MKIESSADRTLDNAAVFAHLNELQAEQTEKRDRSKTKTSDKKDDYELVTGKVHEYFSSAISEGHLPNYENFPESHITDLMTRLKKFGLVKSEMLMLLNLKPRDAIFLDCIIEELDDRHPDADDQGEILEVVNASLGGEDLTAEEDQANQVEEADQK